MVGMAVAGEEGWLGSAFCGVAGLTWLSVRSSGRLDVASCFMMAGVAGADDSVEVASCCMAGMAGADDAGCVCQEGKQNTC
jgi:hypothetical protein